MSITRGQLSSIELLGEDYEDIVAWAAAELRERKRLATVILAEFNDRLEVRAREIGEPFKPISKSAFSRYSVRLSKLARRLEGVREISRVLTDRLQPGDTDHTTIALAEMIKTAVFEGIGEAGESGLDMMGLNFAASALKSAVGAQKTSAELRERAERKAAERAAAAVDQVARAAGMTADTVDAIKAKILGIRA